MLHNFLKYEDISNILRISIFEYMIITDAGTANSTRERFGFY